MTEFYTHEQKLQEMKTEEEIQYTSTNAFPRQWSDAESQGIK